MRKKKKEIKKNVYLHMHDSCFSPCIACRIMGAVFIIAGLYLVLWGKSQERALAAKQTAAAAGSVCDDDTAASCLKQPLLPPPPATSEAV
jgi:hypothetical protein